MRKVLLLILFTLNSARAAEFTVNSFEDTPPDGCQVQSCTLREAVIEANSLNGFHIIYLQEGNYEVNRGVIDVNAPDGITILGEGDWNTVVDAASVNSFFYVESSLLQIINLHLKDGWTSAQGGAISAYDSQVAIINSTLSGNDSFLGGGAIYSESSTDVNIGNGIAVINSVIKDSVGVGLGAAVVCATGQSCDFIQSNIHNNLAITNDDFSAKGEIISANSTASFRFENSSFNNNQAGTSALSVNNSETVKILNSTFTQNSTTAPYNSVFINSSNDVEIDGNTFFSNQENLGSFGFENNINVRLSDNIIGYRCFGSNNATFLSLGQNIGLNNDCLLNQSTDLIVNDISELELLPLGFHKSSTPTLALGNASVARNKNNMNCSGTDQRGIAKNNPSCDVGAHQSVEYCSTPNLGIPDNDANGISDTITINKPGDILDLDVWLDISHTYISDIQVTLTHNDTQQSVELLRNLNNTNGLSCAGNDLKLVMDQQSNIELDGSCENLISFPGRQVRFKPDLGTGASLSTFNNQSLTGSWTLSVIDQVELDTGVLNEWCLLPKNTFVDLIFDDGFQ